VYTRDKLSPLTITLNGISCAGCEQPLTVYSDTLAYEPTIPFQLLEYTFADVDTGGKPFVIDLNVGYNISYLDQVALPVALAPCLTEPCNPDVADPSAVGYLGTTKSVDDFRTILGKFAKETPNNVGVGYGLAAEA
jgi:hypothetical protein